MKKSVLVIGPQWNAQWTESVCRGLQANGCTPHLVYYTEPLSASWKTLRRWVPRWIKTSVKLWHWPDREAKLIDIAASLRPDFILVLKGELFFPYTIRALQACTHGPVVLWSVDDPEATALQRQCLPLFDKVFVHKPLAPYTYLPCAGDSLLYSRVPTLDFLPYTKRLAFIGTAYPERKRVIDAMTVPLHLSGTGWWPRRAAPEMPPSNAAAAYAQTYINLNIHHHGGGPNTRTFEIPLAGGFQLCDAVAGISDLLEPDKEIALYTSPEHCREQVARYLHDPTTRRTILDRGHQRCLAEHTYTHRMKTLLEAL